MYDDEKRKKRMKALDDAALFVSIVSLVVSLAVLILKLL